MTVHELHLTYDELVSLLGDMPSGPDRYNLKEAAFAYLYGAQREFREIIPLIVEFSESRSDFGGLNCREAHSREISRRDSGQLQYGWAVAPDGKCYQHTWILRSSGEIEDLFHWTEHEALGVIR